MQIKLTNVLVAAGFALASFPAFAAEMPADGTKNFSAPSDAPAYFANETVPESARVDHAATFTREEVAAAPEGSDVEPAVSVGTGQHGKHTSAHKSTRHSAGRSRGHDAQSHYAKAESRSASGTKAAGKRGTQIGASKSSTTRHAKTGSGQHASTSPPPESKRTSVG